MCCIVLKVITKMTTTQTKEEFYRDQYLVDLILPLAIEIFEYLHQQVNNLY
jgi:hypothetical protein